MLAISRRDFCKVAAAQSAAIGLMSAGVLKLRANPLGMPIGCQTWPVREMIAKDFPGTLKQLVAAGFQSIELCSPVGYADEGFGGSQNTRVQNFGRLSPMRGSHASVRTSAWTNSERIRTIALPGRKMWA